MWWSGRNNYYLCGGHSYNPNLKRTTWNEDFEGKVPQNKNSKSYEKICYQCGMTGYWSRICRTLKQLVDLYQASVVKKKEENVEANYTYQGNDIFNLSNMTNLDDADLFETYEEKIDT